jgi:16S rRNA (guanine1207-N2)-methyltransferase
MDRKYSCIITNPPIHAGKEVIYKMYEQASISLVEGGSFWIVIQQKHGAPSTVKKLETLFKNVEIVYKKKGFYIIKSFN